MDTDIPDTPSAGDENPAGLGVSALPPMIAAHSPNDRGQWHSLADHLKGTGRRAANFGDAFDSADVCRLIGELHDIGKADPAWQQYLAAATTGVKLPTVDHKHAGAFILQDWKVGTLGIVIAGHHGGLSNIAQLRAKLANGANDGQRAAMGHVDGLGIERRDASLIPTRFLPTSGSDIAGKRRLEFWLRMVFSALIDADRLDTEQHFRPALPSAPEEGRLAVLDRRCAERRAIAVMERADDPVAMARNQLFDEALAHATEPPGWFELTAPTGSGKTITALSFALRHAVTNGHRRVVTAVPFITVTEQVAQVYRGVLEDESGPPVVLEHHSGVNARSESQTGAGLWSRLAVENWDAHVVVTTMVQLLESLFGNSTSRTRKLHRLANSVIVLDEVQSLPWRLIEPTLDVLRELVRSYRCSVVLSTATQPPFSRIGSVAGLERGQLADKSWFTVFERVHADVVREPLSWTDIAKRVVDESSQYGDQCLVVLNTIKDAREVCAQLAGRPGLMHLSSRLCPAHRIEVLKSVKSALQQGDPCILISTQLVEAGIDIDFPVAVRAFGPLPSIAQVAGRVNRHGLQEWGRLVVVDPEDGSVPPEEYKLGTQIARELLRAGGDPLKPETLEIYYDRLIHATEDKLDHHDIQRDRELLNFENVARNYRVVTDETAPVLVRYHDFDPMGLQIEVDPVKRRYQLRDLQRFTVSLRDRDLGKYRNLIEERDGGVLVWHGSYDDMYGLSTDTAAEALIW